MHIKKKIKYGYSSETSGESRLIKPSNLTKIALTPTNSKFLFYGTRHEILKWMSLHPDLLVEYDPFGKDNYDPEFTPPPSPLLPGAPEIFLSSPTSTTPMSTSPISITSPIISTSPTFPTSPTSPISPTSPTFPTFPTSPTSPTSSISSSSFSTLSIDTSAKNENSHDIVFDLFSFPVKTSALLSEETAFSKPLNIALKVIPWLEVMLEIRPVDEHKDSKLHPIHRVILPSGSPLSKISKALEKSWKSLIPDSTAFGPDCFIRNSELIYPQNKSKSESHGPTHKSINPDNDKSSKFMSEIAKHVPTVDLWLRQKQTTGPIPPGVLTPYIVDDVLEDLGEEKEEEEFVSEKKKEAEMDKESLRPDLPQYEDVFGDTLLERG